MIYLETLLYYTFFASVVLIYGVGINRLAEVGITKLEGLTFFIKMIVNIFITVTLSWFFTSTILTPLKLIELYPLIAFLILVVVSTLLEAIVRMTFNKNTTEFILSYLIVLLSISESTSYVNTLLICLSCLLSLFILLLLIYTFKNRITSNGNDVKEKYYSLFFVFLALLIIIISVWDISWFNLEVLQ